LAGVAAGFYVSSFVRGHATHELTHKIRRSKVSREHDREFAELLAVAATRRFPTFQPDLVVSIPERPDGEDRFRSIRTELAGRVGAVDAGAVLSQRWVVANYRQMTRVERREASAGRFIAHQPIDGCRVLLVDDVVTSGWQAREAIRALIAAGAGDWRFAAVARATAAPGEAGARPEGKPEGQLEHGSRARPDLADVAYDQPIAERVIHELIAVEALPPEVPGSRRAVVRWSDGTVGEALRWYADLCGCPHKSSYADFRVMPRGSPEWPPSRGNGLRTSA
jgi:hypothetical protein